MPSIITIFARNDATCIMIKLVSERLIVCPCSSVFLLAEASLQEQEQKEEMQG